MACSLGDKSTKLGSKEKLISSPFSSSRIKPFALGGDPIQSSSSMVILDSGKSKAKEALTKAGVSKDLLVATSKSLETPALVNASFAFDLPESNMTMLELDWIGSPPNANGFILELENGEEMSFSLDPNFVDLSPNEHAICQAVMEIRKPSTGIVSARLTLNGKPISNICKFYTKNKKS